MADKPGGFQSIDEYIATFPEDIQVKLQVVRATIHAAAPEAEERISYNMPAFAQDGMLVYFAAAKKHIGFYALPSGTAEFRAAMAKYEGGKGSVRFLYDEPLPLDLIAQIVRFRVAENRERAAAKASKAKSKAEA